MNYRYTYFQYGTQDQASEPGYGDSEHYIREPGGGFSSQSFTNWLVAGERAFRRLPWVGAAAIGLGVLIVAYPMLLVIAVASVFFFAGALCLGLWWRVRERSQAQFDAEYEWNRLKSWFKKLGT